MLSLTTSQHQDYLNKMIVQRKNQTFEAILRIILTQYNVPYKFWAKAANTTKYIVNKCLICPFRKKILYELLKGKRPNISDFQTFGCRFFVHNNSKNNLCKFDTRSCEGIFHGCSSHSKAHRTYSKLTKIVEEIINVIFYL